MISGSQVYQVARSVARGDGDWAEVPRCVREAIVLFLSTPHMAPAAMNGATHSGLSGASASAAAAPIGAARPAVLSPVLSEGAIQRSVQTFEDAAWVRDQAVRSYAQFHNSVETLHTGMRGQLRALWHTAMQLNAHILDDVRRRYDLSATDAIPDGVPLRAADAARIEQQGEVLHELVHDLQRLRDTSVRFAAHWLTDREMMAMGADPAYLRPEEVDREAARRAHSPHTPQRHSTAVHRGRGGGASVHAHSPADPHTAHAAPSPATSRSLRSSPHRSRRGSRHRDPAASEETDVSDDRADLADAVPREDPQLRELRRQYVARLAELSEEQQQRRRRNSRHGDRHASASRHSTHQSRHRSHSTGGRRNDRGSASSRGRR